jgi:uridine kinase
MKAGNDVVVNVATHGKVTVEAGTTLGELKDMVNAEKDVRTPVVGALCNNRVLGLEYGILRASTVKFLTVDSDEGADIYRRSLSVLLHAAFIQIATPGATLKIEHSLGSGFYYSYLNADELSEEVVSHIEKRMHELVVQDLAFEKMEVEVEEALDIFHEIGAWDRYYLLRYSGRPKAILYRIGELFNLAQGPLVPRTSYLMQFSLLYHPPGLILNFPHHDDRGEKGRLRPQRKLFQIYSEQREWSELLNVESAGKLNLLIIKKKINDLVWLSEGLHEKKIANIADIIARNAPARRVVFLAGPSSSGKTTFAKRLTIQLLANGISPVVISLDNYYLPRKEMPRRDDGNTDYDSLHALDLELIRSHLNDLLDGKRVDIPAYDFKTGFREPSGAQLKLGKDQIVIIEGIHGMNPTLTDVVSKDEPFKIYISALTQLNLDVINRIPTATVRLIRRIVRDSYFRYRSARETIGKWPLVRQGEEKNIFPYQEEADVMFNSSLVYEMSVLKGYVEPLLLDIAEDDPAYTQAKLLLHFTSNFLFITPENVPLTSILREFIGGSGFHY